MSKKTVYQVEDRDGRVRYTGSWDLLDDLGGTFHATTNPGASASFSYQGKDIVVVVAIPSCTIGQSVEFDINVDDSSTLSHKTLACNSQPTYGVHFANLEPEESGDHTVVVTYLATRGGSGTVPLWLDYFQYAVEDPTAPTSSNPTRTSGGSNTNSSGSTGNPPSQSSGSPNDNDNTGTEGAAGSSSTPSGSLPSSETNANSSLSPSATSGSRDPANSMASRSSLGSTPTSSGNGTLDGTSGGINEDSKAVKGVNVETIVGGALGGLFLLALVVLLLVFLLRRRRHQRCNPGPQMEPQMEPPIYANHPSNSDLMPFNILVDVTRRSEKTGLTVTEEASSTFPVSSWSNPRLEKRQPPDYAHETISSVASRPVLHVKTSF